MDAVYEKENHEIVFFLGQNFYVMLGNSHLIAGPLPLQVKSNILHLGIKFNKGFISERHISNIYE